MPTYPSRQQGSALIIAIFIMTVMLLLGSALVQVFSRTQESVIYEVLGARANMAAQSAMEWGLSQLYPLDQANPRACSDIPNTVEVDDNVYTVPVDFSSVPGLQYCSAQLQCQEKTVQVLLDRTRYYRLQGSGTCDSGQHTTSRSVVVDAQIEM